MGPMQHQPSASPTSTEHQDPRLAAARHWSAGKLGLADVEPVPVSGDASFRRYFRIHTPGGPFILMDAPPQTENSRPFLDIAGRLRKAGLRAPDVLHFDLDHGFGLLEDLGDTLYREMINPDSAPGMFPDLFAELARMARDVDCAGLPHYDDARLQAELDLFRDWYLLRHRGVALNPREASEWEAVCAEIKRSATAQKQVFVHRDFHSCNLLYQAGKRPGIIDFQDAVCGPTSYDFVSLIWDRYISWPRAQLEDWMEAYFELLQLDSDLADWKQNCDLMGLQRNLKIVGIFARLFHRDGKHGYVEMIPRFYRYILDVLPRYPRFAALQTLMERPDCVP